MILLHYSELFKIYVGVCSVTGVHQKLERAPQTGISDPEDTETPEREKRYSSLKKDTRRQMI